MKVAIESKVGLNPKSRVYVVYKDNEKLKGRFIIGSRRSAPWAGFAAIDDQAEDTDE